MKINVALSILCWNGVFARPVKNVIADMMKKLIGV